VRVFRTDTTAAFEFGGGGNPMALLGDIVTLYRGGELDVSLPQFGQVAGRIDGVLPVGEIIRRTVEEFQSVVGRLAGQYLAAAEQDELARDDPALAR
jgi:NAD(P)H-dependent flavin oxidoreductase YrpB (nitropropane dioxygenase family)